MANRKHMAITGLIALVLTISSLRAADHSLYFNGTDEWIDVTHSTNSAYSVIPTSGDFTVEVWAKAHDLSGTRNILSQNPGVGFNVGMIDGNVRAGDDWNNTGVPYPTDGLWHHFAIVKTSDNTHLYIDGTLKTSKGSAIRNPGDVSGNNFRIGRQCWEYAEYFNGFITDIRIWNTARTGIQIQENMFIDISSEPVSLTAGLRGQYRFIEGTGATLTWRGSINMNGALKNMDGNNWQTADLTNIAPGSYIIYTPKKGASNAPYSQKQGTPWNAAMTSRPITGSGYGFLWSEKNDSTSFAGFEFNTESYGIGTMFNLINYLAWYAPLNEKREFSTHVRLVKNVNNDQIIWTDRLEARGNYQYWLGRLHFSSLCNMLSVYIQDGQLKFQQNSKWIDAFFTIAPTVIDRGWTHETALTLYYKPDTLKDELKPFPVSVFHSKAFIPISVEYVKTKITGTGVSTTGKVGVKISIGKKQIYFGDNLQEDCYNFQFDASNGWEIRSHFIDFPGTLKDNEISNRESRDENKIVRSPDYDEDDDTPFFKDQPGPHGFDWEGLQGAVEVADFYYGYPSKGKFTPPFTHIEDPSMKDTTVFPRIVNIMYPPPGSGSNVTIASSTTITHSASISTDYSAGGSVSTGISIDPEALSGYCGFEGEVKVGYNAEWGTAESFDYEQSTTKEISIDGGDGDHVLMEELTAVITVLRRKKHPYIFDTSDADNTYVGILFTYPGKLSDIEKLSVVDFLEKYENRPDILEYFNKVYAKDIETGKVRSDLAHLVETKSPSITGGTGFEKIGDAVVASNTKTQTFTHTVSTAISGKVTVGSIFVGGEAEFSLTTTAEKSQSQTTEFTATYVLSDPESWDRIVMKHYLDTINGVRIFAPIIEESYTSNPHEPFTQPAVEFSYSLAENPAPLIVGEASFCTLTVTNSTVNPWAVGALNPRIGSLDVYNDKDYDFQIIPDPKTVILATGESTDFFITYTPLHLAKVPLNLSVEFGYETGPNTIETIGTDAITGTKFPGLITGVTLVCTTSTQRVPVSENPVSMTFPVCIKNVGQTAAVIDVGVSSVSTGATYTIEPFSNPVTSGDDRMINLILNSPAGLYPCIATVWAQIAGDTSTYKELVITIDTLSGLVDALTKNSGIFIKELMA